VFISESAKPRGVVDLKQVQDVREARAATGKANSIQLKTASGGSVAYIVDTGEGVLRRGCMGGQASELQGLSLVECTHFARSL
jgi:hypothetical protein